jgi:hypothetical protein
MAKHWFGVALVAVWVGTATVQAQQPANPGHPPAFPTELSSAFAPPPGEGDGPPGGPECEPPGPFPAENAFDESCNGRSTPPRVQLSIEYLFMWFSGQNTPPLVTIGDINDIVPGALGQPGTRVVSGGEVVGGDLAAGVRFGFVYWLCDPERWSVEGNAFIMEQRSDGFDARSDGSIGTRVLARPYFNPNFNREDSDPRAVPNVMAGEANYRITTRLMGGELNSRFDLTGKTIFGPAFYVLGGLRYLRLDEKYVSDETVTDRPSGAGNTFIISDNFTTYNEFYGAQAGVQVKWCFHNMCFDIGGKVAVGDNHRTYRVSGFTTIINPAGNRFRDDFGLYAQPSNSGTTTHDTMSLVPEFGFNFTCVVNDHVNLKLGYNLLYFTDVMRAGELLDRNINIQPLMAPGQIGPALPQRRFDETDFWVQWVNLGVEFVF